MNEKREVYDKRCKVNRLTRVNITLNLEVIFSGFKRRVRNNVTGSSAQNFRPLR